MGAARPVSSWTATSSSTCPSPNGTTSRTTPAEGKNLFGRSPERDRTLAAALSAFAPALPGQRAAEDPETAARLRALGYVSGGAPAKAKYTEADDPKRLIELDGAIHRALEAFSAGRLDEAAQIYRQVIERRPDMEIALPAPGVHRLPAWRHRAAQSSVLRRAVASGVTDARVRAQLGEYLSDAGQVAEGIRILEPLAGNPAANIDALNALGDCLRTGGPALKTHGGCSSACSR